MLMYVSVCIKRVVWLAQKRQSKIPIKYPRKSYLFATRLRRPPLTQFDSEIPPTWQLLLTNLSLGRHYYDYYHLL